MTRSVERRGDVMECAAYRHRWILAYRTREAQLGIRPPFEPVRVASWESWQSGILLTDEEIKARVEELTVPQPVDREALRARIEHIIATKVMLYSSAAAVREVDDGEPSTLDEATDAVLAVLAGESSQGGGS